MFSKLKEKLVYFVPLALLQQQSQNRSEEFRTRTDELVNVWPFSHPRQRPEISRIQNTGSLI